ncbi:MAG: hypothetical protein EOS80_08010 [Mesorhizobium sp.]|nr:MAG: hypothetical protein EOS80_08010 [Mesorhizobium sp.]
MESLLKGEREAPLSLSCRTSPPQGGRSDVGLAFANRKRCKRSFGAQAANLPLEGEMPGRAERGASRRTP